MGLFNKKTSDGRHEGDDSRQAQNHESQEKTARASDAWGFDAVRQPGRPVDKVDHDDPALGGGDPDAPPAPIEPPRAATAEPAPVPAPPAPIMEELTELDAVFEAPIPSVPAQQPTPAADETQSGTLEKEELRRAMTAARATSAVVSRGVVAAGHPATAEAGAWALREGGNAVDAAIAAVLASVSAESPLTGLGAGGHMLVHGPGAEPVLLDFFVAAPGLDGTASTAELVPVEVDFGGVVQVFNVGAPRAGCPACRADWRRRRRGSARCRSPSWSGPAVKLAREGLRSTASRRTCSRSSAPILAREPMGASIYAPGGTPLREGETVSFGALADTLERFGDEGRSRSTAAISPRRCRRRCWRAAVTSRPPIWRPTRRSPGLRRAPSTSGARSSPTRLRPPEGS